MLGTVLYNLLMLGVDAAAVFVVAQDRSRKSVTVSLGVAAVASVFAAVFLAADRFGVLRLLAYGVFLHAPLLLFVTAWLMWKPSRAAAGAAALGAVLLLTVAADAFLIEPQWLEVTRVRLKSPKIDRKVKIVLIADFQTDQIGDYERRVVERVMQERPDMILWAGDYLQSPHRKTGERLVEQLRRLLSEVGFSAPLGVYAVGGNADTTNWRNIFRGLPVQVFTQTGFVETPPSERAEFRITGLSVADSFNSRMSIGAADQFHIVVGHAPDYALGDIQADLLVAGHTHGGQVRLPGVGPLMTMSQVPRSWAAGVTEIAPGRTLIVSRGVGMERGHAPRLRFLCRPQLVVIELE